MAYEKEGQLGNSVGAVIQLITGVGVAVLVLILVGALGGQTYNLIETDIDTIGRTTISGETFTPITASPVTLDHNNLYAGTFTALSGTTPVGAGNYTLNTATGVFNLTTTTYNNTALTVSYQYQDGTVGASVKNGIISGFSALEQTGNYLPIIVLAVVIALVLFLVLGMSGNTGGGSKGSAL